MAHKGSTLRQVKVRRPALVQNKVGIWQIILRDPLLSRLLVKPVRKPA